MGRVNRISIANPVFNGNEKKYLMECIDTGWVSANGHFVDEFERKFADFCGCRYAISCANGTVSLHLILMALGIGPGDEVIMPVLTYIATANAVRYCGAVPVFVDSEEKTFNINPKKIEEKITERTKAIMPVHLYGLPANMEEIMEIADRYGIAVVEDAAEAHGAECETGKVGRFGIASSFSFFGNKIITCGEGGMITTNDRDLYERMKLLKTQAVSPEKKYWHVEVGYNYRMTNMQAAVGLGQLENIDWHLEQRRKIADLYKKYLSGYNDYLRFQEEPKNYKSVYWMNNVILKDTVLKERDTVIEDMENMGIEMRVVFYPLHIMPPYYNKKAVFPVAEKLAARGISLPSHAGLQKEDVKYICDSLVQCLERD
uniref:Perosamine synthetase n=1 Tax=Eubacterium plexicaudatum ASF492 TaxID=1235802 RepID=N2ANX4_9FIRM